MRIEIGTATSHAQIQSWREAAREVGMPIQMEIWERFDSGGSVSAHVSIYQPDLHPLWYKLVDELRKEGKEPNGWHVEKLERDTIRSLRELYQVKYDATAEGQQVTADKKAAQRRKDEEAMRTHFARADVREAFIDAFTKRCEEESWLCRYSRLLAKGGRSCPSL